MIKVKRQYMLPYPDYIGYLYRYGTVPVPVLYYVLVSSLSDSTSLIITAFVLLVREGLTIFIRGLDWRTACLPTFILTCAEGGRTGGGLGRGIAASSAGDVSTARTQVPTGKMIKVYVRVIKVVINSMIKVYGKPLTYRGDGSLFSIVDTPLGFPALVVELTMPR